MRRTFLLLLVLASCSSPDSDPVDVAQRFHALRHAGDNRGLHALLTEADRAAVPVEAFPARLPSGAARELLPWGPARVDSTSLLSTRGDTADVLLHVAGGGRDSLRLVATDDPLRLWRYELGRVRWRVSMGLAERALIDSLAALVRADAGATSSAAVERAETYLAAAERHPAMARSADIAAARSRLRAAGVAEALRIDLHMAEALRGVAFVEGRVQNPTGSRVATLRLVVRDATGDEEQVELWNVAPASSTPVRQLTRLRKGPLTHRLERIELF